MKVGSPIFRASIPLVGTACSPPIIYGSPPVEPSEVHTPQRKEDTEEVPYRSPKAMPLSPTISEKSKQTLHSPIPGMQPTLTEPIEKGSDFTQTALDDQDTNLTMITMNMEQASKGSPILADLRHLISKHDPDVLFLT